MTPDQSSNPQQPVNPDQASITIPVIEEQLSIGKQVIETGHVRVSKRVHEEQKTFNIPVITEEFEVERVPVNQYLDTAPDAVRYEGDTMIIPVLQEVVVVEKRLLLVEEVRISKRQVLSSASQQVTLRQEEVIVERHSADPSPGELDNPH